MEERDRAGGEAVPLLGPFAEPKPLANAWKYLVTLAALSVVICYADRTNISTAILPMSKELNWDKVRGKTVGGVWVG